MELQTAIEWAEPRTQAVLITLRRDGRAQSSDISYAYMDSAFAISITASRAKTANMRRDPRVVLHLTDRESWSYVSFDGTVALSPVTMVPGDETSDALVSYYEKVAGKAHSDWDEYRQAMVSEGRLIAAFTPLSAVGQLH